MLSFALTGFTLFNFEREEVAVGGAIPIEIEHTVAPMSAEVLAGEIVFNMNCKQCHKLDVKMIALASRTFGQECPIPFGSGTGLRTHLN